MKKCSQILQISCTKTWVIFFKTLPSILPRNTVLQRLCTRSCKILFKQTYWVRFLKILLRSCKDLAKSKILLATVKNSVTNTVFPIWPIVVLPKLCFPNTEYQDVKIDSEIKI